jgi:hypothetical protein
MAAMAANRAELNIAIQKPMKLLLYSILVSKLGQQKNNPKDQASVKKGYWLKCIE